MTAADDWRLTNQAEYLSSAPASGVRRMVAISAPLRLRLRYAPIPTILRTPLAGALLSVVTNVVVKWPFEAIAPLKVQLQALATGSGFYGTDLVALRLLTGHRLADPAWLKEWAQFKTKRLRELLSQAEHI